MPISESESTRRRRESDPFDIRENPFIDVHNSSVINQNAINDPEPQPEPEPEAGDAEHAMDCSDMVIAAVADSGVADIRDYFTLSQATPRLDAFYGGGQSLTAASAFRDNGVTTVVFRKKLRGKTHLEEYLIHLFQVAMWPIMTLSRGP